MQSTEKTPHFLYTNHNINTHPNYQKHPFEEGGWKLVARIALAMFTLTASECFIENFILVPWREKQWKKIQSETPPSKEDEPVRIEQENGSPSPEGTIPSEETSPSFEEVKNSHSPQLDAVKKPEDEEEIPTEEEGSNSSPNSPHEDITLAAGRVFPQASEEPSLGTEAQPQTILSSEEESEEEKSPASSRHSSPEKVFEEVSAEEDSFEPTANQTAIPPQSLPVFVGDFAIYSTKPNEIETTINPSVDVFKQGNSFAKTLRNFGQLIDLSDRSSAKEFLYIRDAYNTWWRYEATPLLLGGDNKSLFEKDIEAPILRGTYLPKKGETTTPHQFLLQPYTETLGQ